MKVSASNSVLACGLRWLGLLVKLVVGLAIAGKVGAIVVAGYGPSAPEFGAVLIESLVVVAWCSGLARWGWVLSAVFFTCVVAYTAIWGRGPCACLGYMVSMDWRVRSVLASVMAAVSWLKVGVAFGDGWTYMAAEKGNLG